MSSRFGRRRVVLYRPLTTRRIPFWTDLNDAGHDDFAKFVFIHLFGVAFSTQRRQGAKAQRVKIRSRLLNI
jgi:hypothetical protein